MNCSHYSRHSHKTRCRMVGRKREDLMLITKARTYTELVTRKAPSTGCGVKEVRVCFKILQKICYPLSMPRKNWMQDER
ncbi:hypothetical protein E2C01_083418 [Portunus trituberculatus]|uniref:Uncharacterized protein n=1 Tax=Portunus trituberculatus TaxID=210409 RepID=A0A5B7IX69_PORTR|nr:hypothetical protein [Portunus trituberculatus]